MHLVICVRRGRRAAGAEGANRQVSFGVEYAKDTINETNRQVSRPNPIEIRTPLAPGEGRGILWILFVLFVPFTLLAPVVSDQANRSARGDRGASGGMFSGLFLFVSFNFGFSKRPNNSAGKRWQGPIIVTEAPTCLLPRAGHSRERPPAAECRGRLGLVVQSRLRSWEQSQRPVEQ